MTRHFPGRKCDECAAEHPRHQKCVGWAEGGFCGCADGLCLLRLITGVMWDITEGGQP